jgi:hypothetical protein
MEDRRTRAPWSMDSCRSYSVNTEYRGNRKDKQAGRIARIIGIQISRHYELERNSADA